VIGHEAMINNEILNKDMAMKELVLIGGGQERGLGSDNFLSLVDFEALSLIQYVDQ
jgi:hypothetical protein